MTEPDESKGDGFWHELASVVSRARDVWNLIGPGDRRRLGLVLIPTLLASTTANAVALIQMDIMVKDDRADHGWLYGTYQYNGKLGNANRWDNLVPVCFQ